MKTRLSQMNLSQRHLDILEMAKQKGFLPTEEMSRVFNVTAQTIRRDINELCDKGLLRRYHGGAGLASSVQNVDYPTRRVLNHEEKIRIARMVAGWPSWRAGCRDLVMFMVPDDLALRSCAGAVWQ